MSTKQTHQTEPTTLRRGDARGERRHGWERWRAMIAKERAGRPGSWMHSKDWPGLYGHESGGVEIGTSTEGVFRFPDGTIVLTDLAVKEIAALSDAAKAASKDRRESPTPR